jgi:N-acetylneuraminic acid mutarotase
VHVSTGAFVFSHENECYAGLGVSSSDKEIWKVVPDNEWGTSITAFPGDTRAYASAFVIDDKMYVGLGVTLSSPGSFSMYHQDFRVYDLAGGEWEDASVPFPGSPRTRAMTFVIDGVAYVGGGVGRDDMGRDVIFTEFYKFDPATGWSALGTIALGQRVTGYTSFVANGEAYFCLGKDQELGLPFSGMYKFSPREEQWTRVDAAIDTHEGLPRMGAAVFVLREDGRDHAYIMSGCDVDGNVLESCWKYDPANNEWTEVAPLPGSGIHGFGFTVDGTGYFIEGEDASSSGYLLWKFDPEG